MKTYLSYQNQIQGLNDVSETVKTVEKIAASSVHFLKQEVRNLNAYTSEIKRILARLSLFYQNKSHPLLQKNNTGKNALIVLTGDKGLIGGLWHRIINAFLENAGQYESIIVVGAKGRNYLEEENVKIAQSFDQVFNMSPKEEILAITDYIFNAYKKKELSTVDILYAQFISLAEQKPLFLPFLPFKFTKLGINSRGNRDIVERGNQKRGMPIFEPSRSKIFDRLLRKYISVFFYEAITETRLAELSARTVEMEHAFVKTKELIHNSALDYMKERRRVNTQKQLESFTVCNMLR